MDIMRTTNLMTFALGATMLTLLAIFLGAPASAQTDPIAVEADVGSMSENNDLPAPDTVSDSHGRTIVADDSTITVVTGPPEEDDVGGAAVWTVRSTGVTDRHISVFGDCVNYERFDRYASNKGLNPWLKIYVPNGVTVNIKLDLYYAGKLDTWTTSLKSWGNWDYCIARGFFPFSEPANAQATGAWQPRWYVDGTYVGGTDNWVTPYGSRADSTNYKSIVSGSAACIVNPPAKGSFTTGDASVMFYQGWNNNPGAAHRAYITWTAEDGYTRSFWWDVPAGSTASFCHSMSIRDDTEVRKHLGRWTVTTHFDGYWEGREAYNNVWSPDQTGSFTLTNSAPTIDVTGFTCTAEPSGFRHHNRDYKCGATLRDSDLGDKIACKIEWGDGTTPHTATITSGGKCEATHRWASDGSVTVRMSYTDLSNVAGSPASMTFNIKNDPPKFNVGSPSLTMATGCCVRGQTFTANIAASDFEGDLIDCAVEWGDGGTSYLWDTNGVCTMTGSYSYIAPGSTQSVYDVYANIDDGFGGKDRKLAGTVTVKNQAPANPKGASCTLQSQPEGAHGRYVCSAIVSDPDGNFDTITCTFRWGDGGVDTVSLTGSKTDTTCTSPPHDYAGYGTFGVTIESDDGHQKASVSASLTVSTPNRAVRNPSSISVDNDKPFRPGVVTASATTTDPDGDKFWCRFDWKGDGLTFDDVGPITSGQTCSKSYQYGNTLRSYTMRLFVRDDVTATFPTTPAATKTITVTNRAPNAPPAPDCNPNYYAHNQLVTCKWDGVTDSDGALDTLTLTINWGDATSSTATVDSQGRATATHDYAAGASAYYTVSAFASDGHAGGDSARGGERSVYVYNSAPNPGGSCTPKGEARRGTTVTCSTSASDPEGDAASVYVDWGDGTNTGWQTTLRSFSHTYSSASSTVGQTFVMTIYAKDAWDQSGGHEGGYIQVVDLPPNTPSVTTPLLQPTTTDRATTLDFTVTGTDPEGDTIVYTIEWEAGVQEESEPKASGTGWNVKHKYTTLGVKCVRAKSTDSFGMQSAWSSCMYITVNNVKPTAVIDVRGEVAPNVFTTFGGESFSGAPSKDPDGDGIVEYCWEVRTGTAQGSVVPGTAQCNATPDVKYNLPAGAYTVLLIVKDGLGARSDPASFTFTVVAAA